jgi:hypothetical protein
MPRAIAIVVSSGKATLKELQTFYGLEDLYNLLEVITVDADNQKKLMERAEKHR